jgi:hypothetical protein
MQEFLGNIILFFLLNNIEIEYICILYYTFLSFHIVKFKMKKNYWLIGMSSMLLTKKKSPTHNPKNDNLQKIIATTNKFFYKIKFHFANLFR